MNQTEFLSQLRRALSRYGLGDIEDILADFQEHFSNGLAKGKEEGDIAAELGDPEEIAAQYAGEHMPLPDAGASRSSVDTAAQPGPAAASGTVYRHADSPNATGPSYGGRETRAGSPGSAGRSGFVHVEDSRGMPRPDSASAHWPAGSGTPSAASPTAAGSTQTAGSIPAAGSKPVVPGAGSKPVVPGAGYRRSETSSYVPVDRTDASGLNVVLLILLGIFVALPVFFTILGILVGIWAAGFGVGAGAVALFVAAIAEAGMLAVVLLLFAIALTALTILIFIGAYWLSRLFALGIGAYVRWNRRVANGGTAA